MAVRIRLSKIGKGSKKKPFFRICVVTGTKSRDSRVIEFIGTYDPAKKPHVVKVDKEKYNKWIKKGARPTETVERLFKKSE